MANSTTTNLSLQKPVSENRLLEDFDNLKGAHSANMDILEKALCGVQSAATTGINASIINTNGNRIVLMQLLSEGCIASITGMKTGMPFTLIYQSSGSMGMADAAPFYLTAALNGAVNTALTLVWDGSKYLEVGRSANG
jgi:hypothetical protein